jgi:putative DNA primase/helicase
MPPAPTVRRYVINDGTVEKVGELLRENPNGLLQCRDELFGWLRTLDREDRSNDRAFFLESFSGDQSYVYDRIGRGTLHIPALCLSIIGGIQPGRLLPYIANAIKGGTGDDGFIQRFQFAVFPDPTAYKRTDYPPNTESRDRAYSVFRELDGIESPESQSPESVSDQFVALRFSDEAQEIFYEWLDANETRARKPDIHEAMEAHLIKYRSLVPSIALILELCDNPAVESVGKKSTVKACAWAEYLYSHAQRIYSASTNPAAANANAILQKLRVGKLPSPFRSRDISIQKWAGLTTRQAVISALDLLQEYGWIQDIVIKPVTGRPSTIYHVHPEVLGDAQESNTPKKA